LKNLNSKSILKNKQIPIINSEIVKTINLSSSFGCICEKIILENGKKFVVKAQNLMDSINYPSVYFEGKSLEILNNKFSNFFPKIYYLEKNFFIMEYINHNNLMNSSSEKDLAKKLAKIHSIKNDKYGFEYNTPIGGLEQSCEYEKSWINFYRNKRLQMIFNIINKSNPMPNEINKGIEKILKNLENYISDSQSPSLIHGDLWQGNILFNNGKVVSFIDPSIYFSNIELELSSLTFLKVVSNDFFNEYSKYNKIEKGFEERSKIYELYYSLLNVHLWSRSYINNTYEIIKKYI